MKKIKIKTQTISHESKSYQSCKSKNMTCPESKTPIQYALLIASRTKSYYSFPRHIIIKSKWARVRTHEQSESVGLPRIITTLSHRWGMRLEMALFWGWFWLWRCVLTDANTRHPESTHAGGWTNTDEGCVGSKIAVFVCVGFLIDPRDGYDCIIDLRM